MIIINNGDLLEAKEQVIGHQTNSKGIMSGGVAKEVKKKYRIMYKVYRRLCKTTNPLGKTLIYNHENKYIANIFGQYGKGKGLQTDYKMLESALYDLKKQMVNLGLISLALPYKMGCRLGGGDWDIVYAIIEKCFSGSGIDVSIYALGTGDIHIL